MSGSEADWGNDMKALSARQTEVMTMIENNRMAPVKYRTTVNSLTRRGLIAPTGEENDGMIVCRLIPTRPVTIAPLGTPCGWTAYGETGVTLTCGSNRDAVHILTTPLPVARKGTALCAFHSPYDVTEADRQAQKAEHTQAVAEAMKPRAKSAKPRARKSGMDVLADMLSLDGGKTPATVVKVESPACRSLKHEYCVGPCPARDRIQADRAAARTHVETEAECEARMARGDYRVGDAVTFRTTTGYRLTQNRPFACRPVCTCGACNGSTVITEERLTEVLSWVSGGLDIRGHLGGYRMVRPDRLD